MVEQKPTATKEQVAEAKVKIKGLVPLRGADSKNEMEVPKATADILIANKQAQLVK